MSLLSLRGLRGHRVKLRGWPWELRMGVGEQQKLDLLGFTLSKSSGGGTGKRRPRGRDQVCISRRLRLSKNKSKVSEPGASGAPG